jgi:hypothetical protein
MMSHITLLFYPWLYRYNHSSQYFEDESLKLIAGEVEEIGFLLADKQAGKFRLKIDWIEGR